MSDAAAAAELAARLTALQARQAQLHEALARRKQSDVEATNVADATFGRLPEYIEKMRRVQQSMDALAVRTTQMRARCLALLQEPRSPG